MIQIIIYKIHHFLYDTIRKASIPCLYILESKIAIIFIIPFVTVFFKTVVFSTIKYHGSMVVSGEKSCIELKENKYRPCFYIIIFNL